MGHEQLYIQAVNKVQSAKNGIGLSWPGLGRGEEKELEMGCGERGKGT